MSHLTKTEIILIAAISTVVIIGLIGKMIKNKNIESVVIDQNRGTIVFVDSVFKRTVYSDSVLPVKVLDTLSETLIVSPENINFVNDGTAPDVEHVLYPIDVNHASAVQLEALPGVGPVIAGRIVEYRNTNGFFVNKKDLLLINGIGPVKYSKIETLIVIK